MQTIIFNRSLYYWISMKFGIQKELHVSLISLDTTLLYDMAE